MKGSRSCGRPWVGAQTTFTYYPASGVTIVTDPRGATTTYTCDSQIRLVSVRDRPSSVRYTL